MNYEIYNILGYNYIYASWLIVRKIILIFLGVTAEHSKYLAPILSLYFYASSFVTFLLSFKSILFPTTIHYGILLL